MSTATGLLLAGGLLAVSLPAASSRAATTTMLCNSQAASVSGGAYMVDNNEWGSSAPECITTNGNAEFKVASSSIANRGHGAPGGYPDIYKGCNYGACTTRSGLPIQVPKIRAGTVTTSWRTSQPGGSDIYNAAYDVWFNQAPATSGKPKGAELMIWLNHHGPKHPYGSRVASNVSIGGRSYHVWFGKQAVNTVSYTMTTGARSVSNLDLRPLVADAVRRGYISTSWYLINVEAGFEVWQGGAGLATRSFSVSVTRHLARHAAIASQLRGGPKLRSWQQWNTPAVAWFPRASRRLVAMIAAGELLVIVALAYLLAQEPGHRNAANSRLESEKRAYEKWVNKFAAGLGGRPAVVVVEPDALAELNDCSDHALRQARLQMLSRAVKALQSKNDQVYLDAGHSNWVPAGQMARRLRAADIAQAYGFALNVSNYEATGREVSYATELDRDLGMAKRFVVDTSRNGQASAGARAHLAASALSRALPGAGRGALASRLFADPGSQAAIWVRAHPGDPRARELRRRIASQPTAMWFGPWSGDITAAVSGYVSAASRERKVPVLVAYDIPHLGCLGNSAAGARQWCNPPGRQLGSVPRVLDDRGDMGLWIKAPGESDGDCGVGAGTRMGEFSPVIATDLITGKSQAAGTPPGGG